MTTTTLIVHGGALDQWIAQRRTLGQDKRDEVWSGVVHLVPGAPASHGALVHRLSQAMHERARRRGLVALGALNLGTGEDDFRVPDMGPGDGHAHRRPGPPPRMRGHRRGDRLARRRELQQAAVLRGAGSAGGVARASRAEGRGDLHQPGRGAAAQRGARRERPRRRSCARLVAATTASRAGARLTWEEDLRLPEDIRLFELDGGDVVAATATRGGTAEVDLGVGRVSLDLDALLA